MPARRFLHRLVLVLLWLVAPATHARELALAPGTATHDLAPALVWYHDADARLDADEARQRLAAGDFRPLPGGRSTFGFQPGAFWFAVRLVNHDPAQTRRLLVQQYSLSDWLDLYVQRPGQPEVHVASGDRRPFDQRAIRYRHPNFWLDLPVGEPVDVLLRVRSDSSMQVPLVLYTPTAFTERARDAQFGVGLYYGILLALFFYNLILWTVLRDASYFWYMAHIAGFGLVLFCLNGLAFEYFWPNSPWLQDRCVPVSICLAQIGMQQFARHFLGLRQRWPRGDRIGLALIAFFSLLGVAALFLPYRLSTPIASAAVFPSVAWIVVETLVTLKRGYAPARLFLFAWAMFLVGTAAYTMVAFGVLPKLFFTEYGVQIGSALEMVLLSFALAYRYAALRNENEHIVREANERLERNVALRTGELRLALDDLATAHARLSESNRRDALTGVYNRHHFRELLEDQLRDAREGDRHLAVLMIDLDHFKQINDRHGHLAGDTCLQVAARTMAQAVAARGGVLARFGGEEFVAALPGHSAEEALAVAESVRQRVAAEPAVLADGSEVFMTVSIGVHALDSRRIGGPDQALQLADEALYSAKHDGRNCVRPVQVN